MCKQMTYDQSKLLFESIDRCDAYYDRGDGFLMFFEVDECPKCGETTYYPAAGFLKNLPVKVLAGKTKLDAEPDNEMYQDEDGNEYCGWCAD